MTGIGSLPGSVPEASCATWLSERDHQPLAENDRTASDTAQTLEDADQSASDSDQTSADRDQDAAASDQVASDRDLASGVNGAAHEFRRSSRERSARKREQTARERLQVAEQRDAVARLRDLAAVARDQAADARDLAMAQFDAALRQHDGTRAVTGAGLIISAPEHRARAVQHRARAASQRLLAAEDRNAAARDRELAAAERHRALRDRKALSAELDRTAVDELTGARTRAAGLLELDHELDRARRTGTTLVVTYIDVVGLKVINDTLGHHAGDTLLKRVVAAIKLHVRSYDLIVRVGGDEFLCAMPNLPVREARGRFQLIAETIVQIPEPAYIDVGFAELLGTDVSADEMIARADTELIRSRRR